MELSKCRAHPIDAHQGILFTPASLDHFGTQPAGYSQDARLETNSGFCDHGPLERSPSEEAE